MPRILHVHFKPKHNVGDAAVVLAIRQLVGDALPGTRWTSLPVKALRGPPTAQLLRSINGHDAVIVGGGGFCSKFALPLDAALVAAIEPPIALFGVGHNRHFGDPGLDDAQRASLAQLAGRARLVGVRDGATQALLAGLGAPARLTGDPAIFLRPVRPWWPPRRRRPLGIGLNLAAHGWTGQADGLDRAIALFRDALGALAADADLWYLVHTDRERAAAAALRRAFPRLRTCRYPAAKLLWAYGRLDLVVSMMLHSSIFAFAAGVPVVNVAYDEKNRAFLEDLGHPERCLPVGEATSAALEAACRATLADPRREQDRATRSRYEAEMREFVGQFAALAAGGARR
jgi:polysaccharide pyruvyl transferase WcaK-like protein